MDLNWVKFYGFKRFEKATLNTSGKVIALVGANEAGKSSILEALTFLNDDRPFNQDIHLTRGDVELNDEDIILEAGFILDEKDREAISKLDRSRSASWLIITKNIAGKRKFDIKFTEKNKFPKSQSEDKDIVFMIKIIEFLKKKIPRFLFFSEQDRNLESTFNLAQYDNKKPSKALNNLLRLADLNINKLIGDHWKNPRNAKTEINKANKKIDTIFKNKWSQSEVKPVLSINNNILRISFENTEGYDFDLSERSDGLRQFVALINFLEKEHAEQPILLVDEAELHLHYDAQADLMDIFSNQQFASKIIYTTHSVGCLPEDLGTGVKLVTPVKDVEERSTIDQHFWSSDNSQGILPLLFGMGASQLSFMAIRQSILVEGETDMMLLPTIFRQCMNIDHNGFQVLPGIATISPKFYNVLKTHGSKVVFLVDNDQRGRDYKQDLIDVGIRDTLIYQLPEFEKLEVLEDYIRKDLYLEAVNKELGNLNNNNMQNHLLLEKDIPDKNRPKAIKDWCEHKGIKKKIHKVQIAYNLLDLVQGERQEMLIEENLQDKFIELYKEIMTAFQDKSA